MQKLQTGRGYPRIERSLRHLQKRLRLRALTQTLGEEVQRQRKETAQAREEWLDAREERAALTLEIELADNEIDQIIAQISKQALIETKGDRKAVLYTELLPSSPSEATKLIGGNEQTRYVKAVLHTLATHTLYQEAKWQEYATSLGTAQADLESSLHQREEAYQKEGQAYRAYQTSLEASCRAYNLAFSRLNLLFPEKPRLVESFFPVFKKKELGDPAEEPSDPTDESE